MKIHTYIIVFCCLIITGNSIVAKDTDSVIPEPESSNNYAGKETRILLHMLQMDKRELTRLRKTIERIENMSPKEKARLRTRISAIPPEKISAIRRNFGKIPREQREAMHNRWTEMSLEERDELRAKLRQMTPEERLAFLREKGLPPSPIEHRENHQQKPSDSETTDEPDSTN